ncbi:MAG TPA: DUF3466 family protein [Rhizomicrobium sp.]|jgi:uncharacterized membrane protein|nr:DUF3466 family protein [Rhizomicrobium sp.]
MRKIHVAMGILRHATLAAGITLAMVAHAALADGKWKSFQLGSTETIPSAINDKGVIAGFYIGDTESGFLRMPDGTVTSFDVVQGRDTQVAAINTNGAVTGNYAYYHGYLRAPDGAVTSFDPAGSIATYPAAINDKGVIAGYWMKEAHGQIGLRGFVRTPSGKLKTFNVPKALNTYANAINESGVVAGSYEDANKQWHGLVRAADGTLTIFSISNVQATNFMSTGINASGQIVGYYADSNDHTYGFLRDPDGTITILDYSNGYFIPSTKAYSINDSGQIAGGYVDSAASHGFVRSPDGQVTTLDFPGNEDGTATIGINRKGQVTGYYLLGGPCTAYTFCGFAWKP